MAKFTWDHIHLRTTDPEAMAQWFEKTLGAEVLRTMQQGKPRIDLKIGGANNLDRSGGAGRPRQRRPDHALPWPRSFRARGDRH